MSYRAKAFPHPVLSSFSSDFGGDVRFRVEVDRAVLGGENLQDLEFDYALSQSSTWMDEFVIDGNAKIVLDVECRATMYREYLPITGLSGHLNFPSGLLYGSVLLTPLIVADKDYANYRPEGINLEFGSSVFAIKRGDILGIGESTALDLEFARTLERNLITIQYSDQLESEDVYKFELGGPRIIIIAGMGLRHAIGHMRADPALRRYLFISVYKDCLAAALNYLVTDGGGLETDLPWGRRLLQKLDEVNRPLIAGDPDEQEISAQMMVSPLGMKKVGAPSA